MLPKRSRSKPKAELEENIERTPKSTNTETMASQKGRKRKITEIDSDFDTKSKAKSSMKKVEIVLISDDESEEPRRLKKYRSRCPQTVQQRLERVQTQRMFCLGRNRDELNLMEEFKVAGTTGNIYTITVANIPTCDCPDSSKNGTCKHILFVMTKVLRVRDDLSYQAALLNSEIREIFQNTSVPGTSAKSTEKRRRKPLDEDGCPICYEDFEPNDKDILYCVAQCGSNIHKQCFRRWVASLRGGKVTCVMCRAPWEKSSPDEEEYGNILENAKVGDEGYLNVAEEMGISTIRDNSTYWSPNPYRRFNRKKRVGPF